jgi:hypothetical protein
MFLAVVLIHGNEKLDLRGVKQREAGEICVMWNFIVCSLILKLSVVLNNNVLCLLPSTQTIKIFRHSVCYCRHVSVLK